MGTVKEIEGQAIEQIALNTGEVVQYAKRPVILNGNAAAYGLYVTGSSMEPRHMEGEIVLIDPKSRLKNGDDVVVYLRPDNADDDDGAAARAVMVKRLVRRSSTYIELEQFNPAKIFRVDMCEVVRVDRVIPWSELIG
ncbi:MAG: S24 family peptidase [Oxalobacteraceae bacterium]|nr:MAG: S24 family peptidase [Oxalobacteraceae bacterium]